MRSAYRITGDHVEPVEGELLLGVHEPTECKEGPCVVHNPSAHAMATWPLNWRDDRSLFERICEHGVGHPDPDQAAYWRRISPHGSHTLAIHGCCGCCLVAVGWTPPTEAVVDGG